MLLYPLQMQLNYPVLRTDCQGLFAAFPAPFGACGQLDALTACMYPVAMKTRAMQMLDAAGVTYEVRTFQEETLGADEVAAKLGIPLEQVFKTLVLRGDRTGVILACVPGTASLSVKELARLSANKKVEMVDKDEIHRLTGYLRGGVSPLGGKKAYAVYVDGSALNQPRLSISAGMRGLQIVVAPQDLVRVARATIGDLTETASPHA